MRWAMFSARGCSGMLRGFPAPAKMGKRLTWRRRELLDWWDAERDRQKRNRAA